MVRLKINGRSHHKNNGKGITLSDEGFHHQLTEIKNMGHPLNKMDSSIKRSLDKLDRLVGLKKVKENLYEICAYIAIQEKRNQLNLSTESQSLHMLFLGSPGTGKTTVARILGEIFKDLNHLPEGHLVEVERADLVGEYIGQTAQKTKKQINNALGGILFIDEAYSLARGGSTDFGKEAIDTLVKAMEDYKDRLVVILAGYRDEMKSFLASNPGISSRFPIQIEFSDYNSEQLLEIADKMLEERQYLLDNKARQHLLEKLKLKLSNNEPNFSNARFVRNLLEKSIRRQAIRLINKPQVTRNDLIYLRAQDLIHHDDSNIDRF
ncbi:AAA family ATPase [Natranaerobius trueperi]|uniref:Stage V sporulation protein K n=1 Tax=Natranaerobius trueperi TaxID=759412 RepID=A0A226BY14_9FIRM|nr:AAA family ATPase [Natranaerobius trueperi]OWZ83089.1 stage V sporulation protein K [Natranaerobius trueperi]